MTEVLVTGANGVLGKEIVHRLRNDGYSVVRSGRTSNADVDVRWDVSSADGPIPDCAPSVVVHAAAKIGGFQGPVADAQPLFETNVMGTLRVARWCIARNVRHLILISGAIVYGEWGSSPKSEADITVPGVAGPYAASKANAEVAGSLAEAGGVKVSTLRLSSLIGASYPSGLILRLLDAGVKRGAIRLTPPFDDAFDLLDVRDGARAISMIVERGHPGLWNIGSGRLTTIQTLAEHCAARVGAVVEYAHSPSPRRPRIINWLDTTKASRELHFDPAIALSESIARIADSVTGNAP
jgi:nucleoside-diphosphate-sugar epimerase